MPRWSGLRRTGRVTRRCAVALLLVLPRPVFASAFTVQPTQVFLTARSTSTLLTLRNETDEVQRFQLSAFAWNQSPTGEMKLDPTTDIVFFPRLLALGPKEERKVRLGATTTFGAAEKTYRVFIEELPSQNAAPSTSAVRVLTKIGVPIFLQPPRREARLTLSELRVDGSGLFRFSLRNDGTIHFVPDSVRVRGFTARGDVVVDRNLDVWYVLASGSRAFQLQLPVADCGRITALSVEVQAGGSTLRERLETPPAACHP